MSILLFILVLSILIVVHEAGHFFMAKKAGVRVEQFALGFGPKLYARVIGGTEFCWCLIPLGGYVKMAGDERSTCKGGGDEYFAKSLGSRALIVLMGPVVNYLLAYVCFVGVFMIGYIDMDATQKKVPAIIGKVMVDSPAAKAGLKLNDKVLSADGHVFANWSDMQDYVSGAGDKALTVAVLRDGLPMTLVMTPEFQQSKDIFGRERRVSRIGVQPVAISSADKLVVRKYGFIESWGKGFEELLNVTTKTYGALWNIAVNPRSAKEGMTGLIGIFFIIKFAAGVGVSLLLHVVGVISASLAIFNLLPIIPLDGGHLALIGLERGRGKPLSVKAEDIIAKVGFFFIIALAVFVFYLDFQRIGLIDRISVLLSKLPWISH